MGVSGNLWILVKDVKTLVVYDVAVTDSTLGAPKSLQMVTAPTELKDTCSWEGKL